MKVAARWAACLALVAAAGLQLRAQQTPLRKIYELDLAIRSLNATVEPTLVMPKAVHGGVRVTLRTGAREVSLADVARMLGGGEVHVEGELSGPGLPQTLTLPKAPEPGEPPVPGDNDPLLLRLPPLPTAGDYTLANLRLVRDNKTVLDVTPRQVAIQVIDEILITSVKTRPLTLDEIKQRGIVLDSDDYLGFEFTLAMKLESTPVNVTFPVVFDRQNIPVPELLRPPSVSREGVPLPTMVPVMLEPEFGDGGGPGEKVPLTPEERAEARIPGILVIPGNVGYLKQFFSAQLFVANGAPSGSRLSVHEVTGTIELPKGDDGSHGTGDDPLVLAETETGVHATLPVRAIGPDGVSGTGDDGDALNPGEQGQAEFLIRGEREGFHEIKFDIRARLEGLAVGPVTLKGKASGGVLVRNAYYDMTFTAPAVVRDGERFTLYTTVTNIGQGIGNDIKVTIDAARMGNMRLYDDSKGTLSIDTLMPGDSETLEFEFVSEQTGQVVASYIKFDTTDGSTGRLNFTTAIGDRGVPLSPDTLVLPAVVDALPKSVLKAAMRVLGQAWSAATAPPGTLPSSVTRPSKELVLKKAQAVAEAGLRMTLGQPLDGALRDLTFDLYGGAAAGGQAASLQTRIDRGFDQALRETNAGYALAQALGEALAPAAANAGGALAFERELAQVAASGPDFISIAVTTATADAADVSVINGTGQRSVLARNEANRPDTAVPGLVFLPLGEVPAAQTLALIATTTGTPYTLELTGRAATPITLSVTLPRGDGTFTRGQISGITLPVQGRARLVIDPAYPDSLKLRLDATGDGTSVSEHPLSLEAILPQGPKLLSANVIGPETLDNAAPFGQHAVLVFDRLVDAAAASNTYAYTVPKNAIAGAQSVLSGRLVVVSLEQPEGSFLPTTLAVSGMTDLRGVPGIGGPPIPLGVRLNDDGAIVSGRVLQADGTPVSGGFIYYRNNKDLVECKLEDGLPAIAKLALDAGGNYEFRYVRRDNCGFPFEITTVDPGTNGVVGTSRFVRADAEHIVVDLVLFGRGSVTGTVKDTHGNGVGGADVVVLSGTDSQIGGKTQTDGLGRYTVGGITVGPVTVRAAKGPSLGYAAGRIDRAGTTATIDVSMDGDAVTVSGTVLRRDGASIVPLPGAWVGYRVGLANGPVVGIAQTNETGFYQITGMPTGAYTLDATSEGYHAYRNGVAAAGDDIKDQHLLIERPGVDNFGTVRGTVRYPSGAPGADAYVVVEGSNRGMLTGSEGTFEVPVPVGTPVTIRATLRNGTRSGSTTVELTNAGDQLNNVAINLSGLAKALVTVVEPDGATRIPNVVVRRLDCNDVCGCAAGTTDQHGQLTIDRLKLGTTRLQVIRPAGDGFDVAMGLVSLSADDQTVPATLRFNGQGTVAGIVKDADGGLLHGADIELTSMRFINDGAMCGLMPSVSHRVRTDTNGAFRITGVNVGPLEVIASHFSAPRRVGQKGALTGAGRQAQFELRLIDTMAGELSGVIFLPDGVTKAGADVEVTVNGMLPDITVRTDETGAFAFAKVLPEGRYTLTARDPITGGLARTELYLRAGQDVTHNLRLKGRGTVRVTVVDAADVKVNSAFVKLTEVDFPSRTYERTIEGAHQGVATFERIFEGAITLEASDAFGRGGRLSTVVPGPDAVVEAKIRLGIVGKVHGRFSIPDPLTGTKPVAYGVVKLLSSNRVIGQATTSTDDPLTAEDETGEFSFDYVPAGPFRLEAQDPASARTGVGAGTITAQDEDVEANITAQALGTVTGTALSNTAPRPNARVTVQSGQFKADTIADNTGRYIVTGVPEGRVIVTASLDGSFLRGTAEGALSGEGNTLNLDVPLHDSGTVEGQVTTAAGAVAPHVLVAAAVTGSGGDKQSTTANAEGRFRFERMPTGNVTVDVELPGSIDRGRATVNVLADQAVSVPVRLNGTGALKVMAFDTDNNATAGYVEIKGTGAFPYTRGFDIGGTGVLTIPELLAGPVTVTLRTKAGTFTHYGTNTGAVTANQLPDQPDTIEVRVQSTGTVRGIVLLSDGVRAAVGAVVSVTVQGVPGILSGVTKDDGSFELHGVPYGSLSVRVEDSLGVGVKQGLTLSEADDDADAGTIVLDDNTISVQSIDPPNGTTGVLSSQVVRLTFSDPIASTDGITAWIGAERLWPSIVPSADKREVTMTLNWPSESQIDVRVSTELTDIYGRHPVDAFASAFHTADSAPPSVVTMTPADNDREIDPAAVVVVVTFNEDLGASGLDSVVTLTGPNGAIAGTSELTGPRVITWRAAYPLQANARYTARASGARDLYGNVQTVAKTATFSTTDTTPPEIRLSSPSNGSKTTNRRPTISFYVNEAVTSLDPASASMTIVTSAGPLPGVTPTLTSSSLSFTPTTDLPLGTVTVSASISDVTNHPASASGSFTVQVEPIGTLTGRLFMPDGVTPAAGYTVYAPPAGYGPSGPSRITDANGEFTFETIDARSYDVTAVNQDGKWRARERVTVAGNATATVDLRLVAEGRITGQVLRPGGAPAPANLTVSVQSHHPQFSGLYSVKTNASGVYAVERVAVGNVTVTVNDTASLQRGEATGTVAADQTATINVQLVANAVALPERLYDGNNYNLYIQPNGQGANPEYEFTLELVRDGVMTAFAGAANGSREENNREIAIRQTNVAGLDVTRKIFVPANGYFYRYLELLSNPGATPVTVSVRVRTGMSGGTGGARIITSSSGEDLLNVSDPATADRWVTLDDNVDAETGTEAMALVFDGEGGTDSADDAQWITTSPRRAVIEWQNITIQPGQTAAVMHFGARLASRVGAQAAAERLVQLPPEALTGLSADEIASIRNFAVPADGISLVAPLPAVNGTITGKTFAGDGTTAVSSSTVRFRSRHPLFGRTHPVSSNSQGVYTVSPQLVANGNARLVPIADFDVTAQHPLTAVLAASNVTSFPAAPAASATADIVFTGTGQIEGVVRWRTGAVANSADIYLPKPDGSGANWFFRSDVNGRYVQTGIPAGTYTITAYGQGANGPGIPGTATLTVPAGGIGQADITLIPVGSLTGTLRRADGSVLTGHGLHTQLVSQSNPNTYWWTNASSGTGTYTIANVPTGAYWLQANDPITNVQAKVAVTINENQTTVQDLTFIANGSVTLQVLRASGAQATGIRVSILETARGIRRDAGLVDANGRITITGVALGTFSIEAQTERDTRFVGTVAGRIDNHGQIVPLTATMPAYGSITGRVTRVTGAPVASAFVQGFRANNTEFVAKNANSDGYYTLEYVWANEPIRVYSSFGGTEVRSVMTSVADGETKEVNLVLSGLATVRVTVKTAAGAPIPSTSVSGRDAYSTGWTNLTTNTSGVAIFNNVREGEATFVATGSTVHARVTRTILPSDHGQTVDLTITAAPEGTLTGTVFAADGVTPVRNATVQVYDPDTTNLWYQVTTNSSTGVYSIPSARGDKLMVRARSPHDSSVTAERPTAIQSAGETVTADLTLPVSAVKGRVYFGDGVTAVPSPTVFVTQRGAGTGAVTTFTHNWTGADGQYVVIGPAMGAFTITAQDTASSLLGETTGALAQLDTPALVDITLQQSGTVTGILRNAQGNTLSGHVVSIGSSGLGVTRAVTTGTGGRYTFNRVALGTILLQARTGTALGGANATLTVQDETVNADIAHAALGTVSGVVLAADGVTPVANATVQVYPLGSHGSQGFNTSTPTTNASGQYSATNVPVGAVRVVATTGSPNYNAGFVDGVLIAGTLTAPPLVLNNNARWMTVNQLLTDAGGFRYDLNCAGQIVDGSSNAYNDGVTLNLSGVNFPCTTGATASPDGRTISFGPLSFGNAVRVTRDVFVPADASFVRYVESFTNDTAAPITVRVQIGTNLGANFGNIVIVPPENTGGTYAVTDNNSSDGTGNPAIGHVFAGAGASLMPVTHFVNGSWTPTFRWPVTIAPGQTVSVMHFQVQRTLRADAQAQADALASLTDPVALIGLTPAQRASIVNFLVP